jgi:hypothetical protein
VIQGFQGTFYGPDVKDDSATPSLRSYGEIAAMLADRDGSDVSEERVRQICGAAERKIARALWNDPVVWKLLTSPCLSQSVVDSKTAHDKAGDRQTLPFRDHPSARDERVTELLP